jgi:hypothetical protein
MYISIYRCSLGHFIYIYRFTWLLISRLLLQLD